MVLIFVYVRLSIDDVILIEIRTILMLYFVDKVRKHARVETIHGHENLTENDEFELFWIWFCDL